MPYTFIHYVNFLIVYLLLITGILIFKSQHHLSTKISSGLFLVCTILYVSIGAIQQEQIKLLLLFGPFLVPYSFWVLARSIFNDKPIKWINITIYGVIVLVANYVVFFLLKTESQEPNNFLPLVSRSISLLFVVLAIYESQKQRTHDLVNQRRRIRTIFTYAVSIIVLLTLLAELGLQPTDQTYPQLFQRLVILFFSTYFLVANTSWNESFLGKQKSRQPFINDELAGTIQSEVITKQLYRQEALTISQLARQIGEQEYKVRLAINQQLGYRNFTDFVNSFRIKEAREILADPQKQALNIQEVAYKVGFNSIGPFNRAFKAATGTTPSGYRKQAGTG